MLSTKRGNLTTELIKGAVAGALATWCLERVTSYLYEHENAEARRREDEVRKGKHAYLVAAEKTARLTRTELSQDQQEKLGNAFHWGLGIGAGVLYAALRKRVGWLEWGQGTLFGLLFFLSVDEGLNTIFRLTPSPRVFPWQAHARGLAGHLVYGIVADSTLHQLDRPV